LLEPVHQSRSSVVRVWDRDATRSTTEAKPGIERANASALLDPDSSIHFYTAGVSDAIPLRSDARRNREAILNAARELFAESGDVAMYEVARRAGVGQATLYRNFPDRDALIAALSAEWLDDLERVGTEHDGQPDAFFLLLQAIVDSQTRFHGLVDCAKESSAVASGLEPAQQRLAQLIEGTLRDAKAAGLVRDDLRVEDVFLVMAMVEGALSREVDGAGRAAAAARVLALALDGLAAPR
jgi:AcrR family transcriptional regulator